MLAIKLIVATRNRLNKLYRMLDSLAAAAKAVAIEPFIIFDADPIGYDRYIMSGGSESSALLVNEHRGSVYCRNLAMKHIEQSSIIFAVDDIIFTPGSIDQAADELERLFSGDGVIGFSQIGVPNWHPSGITMIGAPFIDRYPNKIIFCPQYYHFAAQEIFSFASKLKRFHLSKALIYHYHPSWHRDEADKTHNEARKHKAEDQRMKIARAKKKLIWGFNG
jgi:hypothetical protein